MLVNNDVLYAETLQHITQFNSWVVDVETNGLDPYGYNQICGIGVAVNDSNLSTYSNLKKSVLPMIFCCAFPKLSYNIQFKVSLIIF